MAYYSKKHYNLVNPPADTKEDIAERLRTNTARLQAIEDRRKLFPIITLANMDDACDYFEKRMKELLTITAK